MISSNLRRCALLAAVGVIGLAAPASAMARTPTFGCTASVARATPSSSFGPFASTQYLVRANPAVTPCQTASRTLGPYTSPSEFGVSIAVQKAGAFTANSALGDPTADLVPSAGATASTVGVTITYPDRNTGGTDTIELKQATASASIDCVAGFAIPSGSSTIGDIDYNGKSIFSPDAPGVAASVTLPDGGSIAVNQSQSASGRSWTQDAAIVTIPNVGVFTIDEANVDAAAGQCAGVSVAPGTPTVTLCPAGSTFVPTTLLCQILGGGATTAVTVSQPYAGPTGGVVEPLALARAKYPGNPCVRGAGPDYVIVATAKSHIINGTRHADRILGLGFNDRLAGLAGNDCIDAGNGTDLLYDSQGADHVYAGNGHDRVGLGNGEDYIKVGNGRDWVSAGRGNDTFYLGGGSDRIDTGRGRNRIHTGHGRDRVFAPGSGAQVTCGNRLDLVFVTRGNWGYAAQHGCVEMRMMKK
jgi:Ca2+-binding RTX toxin-like protein